MGTPHDNDDLLDRLLRGEDVSDVRLTELVQRATRPAVASELSRIDPALVAFRRSTRPTILKRAARHVRGIPAAAAAVAASVLLVGGGLGIALTHALSTPSTPTATTAPPTTGHEHGAHSSGPQSKTRQGTSSSPQPRSHHAAHGQGPVPSIPRGSSTTSLTTFYGICTAWELDQHGLAESLPTLEQSTEYQRLVAAAAARDESVAALCGALTGTPANGVAHPNSVGSTGSVPTQSHVPTSTSPGRPSQVP